MKRHIREFILVPGDPATIRRRLRDEFLRAPKVTAMRLPFEGLPIPGDLALSKEIRITAKLLEYSANMADDLEIEFCASNAKELFPVFRGILDVSATDDPACSCVELTGSYEPPFGFAGMAIDTAIGYRIAQRSVRSLLSEIGQFAHPSASRISSAAVL